MKTVRINIAGDYTTTPGARKKTDGSFSGEEFREDFLETYFKNPENQTLVEIAFDGVEGYATSFLEETFGGLARKYGKERCLKKLIFISKEDKLLIDEIKLYITNCDVQ